MDRTCNQLVIYLGIIISNMLQLREKRKCVEGLSRPVTEFLMANELKEELE